MKAPVSLASPAFEIVFAAVNFDMPPLKTYRFFALSAPDLPLPRELERLDSRSPRAPPVVPA